MSKITIIDGNDKIELSTAPKENIKAYMVKGEPGTNGTSPSAVVTKVDDTTTLTVTDANGTTQSNIMDGYNPTITAEKENKVTTLTITDINGTATTEIYDGLDITGGVPTNAVMGFDVTELIYTCDGTESGTYYFTYDNVDYYFTMPTVEDGDKLIFNIDDLELTLDGNIISTSSSGTGTELTFLDSIPAGYEITNEKLGGADIPQQATAPLNPEENDLWIDTDETGLTTIDSTVSTSSTNPVENQAITNYVNGIIESGSNTNGYWIKYSDGTLIQTGTGSCPSGTGYAEITFPIEFIDTNIIMTANHKYTGGSGYGGSAQLRNITNPQVNTSSTAYVYSYIYDGSVASYIRNVQWVAIGRWKA